MSSAICSNLDQSKIFSFGNGLIVCSYHVVYITGKLFGSTVYLISLPQFSLIKDEDPTVMLSKTLSSILRHNAERYGLKLMKGEVCVIYRLTLYKKTKFCT